MGSVSSAGASIDLQPLLDILSKVSIGRVLPHADLQREGELTIAKIPVKLYNSADKAEVALRRFSADWLSSNVKDVAVDTKFEKVKGLSWYSETEEIPIVGIIHLSWWPKGMGGKS